MVAIETRNSFSKDNMHANDGQCFVSMEQTSQRFNKMTLSTNDQPAEDLNAQVQNHESPRVETGNTVSHQVELSPVPSPRKHQVELLNLSNERAMREQIAGAFKRMAVYLEDPREVPPIVVHQQDNNRMAGYLEDPRQVPPIIVQQQHGFNSAIPQIGSFMCPEISLLDSVGLIHEDLANGACDQHFRSMASWISEDDSDDYNKENQYVHRQNVDEPNIITNTRSDLSLHLSPAFSDDESRDDGEAMDVQAYSNPGGYGGLS
jgi:hypothetical protein